MQFCFRFFYLALNDAHLQIKVMHVQSSHERNNIRKNCLSVLVVNDLLLGHKELREKEIFVLVLLVNLLSK